MPTPHVVALPAAGISLEEKLACLRAPSCYPQFVSNIETIETHMSWVFLTNENAYKLKKPIRHDIFDFRAIEARRHFCEEEVRLNRRLAEDVYLAVVPLCRIASGELRLESAGEAIDWLVKMRRLPAERMLDRMIANGTARPQDIVRVAQTLAEFYKQSHRLAIEPRIRRAVLMSETRRNRRVLSRAAYQLPADQVRRLCDWHRSMLRSSPAWLEERLRGMHIVEGHGDLRPEHVCIRERIDIIDCLEAAPHLRLLDPADEVGYLALEIERLGAPAFSSLLLQTWREASGDAPDQRLVHFYQSLRACIRARLAAQHLDEAWERDREKWMTRTFDYLGLAERHQASASAVSDPPS
ncbi:MAG TPA: hypothetical protein VF450_01860 [Noviherbaspirillum sp.]